MCELSSGCSRVSNGVPWKQDKAPSFTLTAPSSFCITALSQGAGAVLPPPQIVWSRRREVGTSHRVWDLSDRPQQRIGRRGEPPTPPLVALLALPYLLCSLPPSPCISHCSACPLGSDIICKGRWIGLLPWVLTYLDTEIILSALGFHFYILKFLLPIMSLK